MELNSLPKITKRKAKRLGRGHGSGRGKTSGRGTKGQKARGTISLAFEGGALPLVKRLPFLRGRGRNKVFKSRPIELNIDKLNKFKPKTVVDIDSLIKNNLIPKKAKSVSVKLLGKGELKVPLTVRIPSSKSAKQKIEKIGGTVQT